MSTKIFDWNRALTNQTLLSLALMGRHISDEENSEVDNGRGDGTQEGLGDDDGGVQLEVKDQSFRPVWKDNAGEYLRRIRGCGLSATENVKDNVKEK